MLFVLLYLYYFCYPPSVHIRREYTQTILSCSLEILIRHWSRTVIKQIQVGLMATYLYGSISGASLDNQNVFNFIFYNNIANSGKSMVFVHKALMSLAVRKNHKTFCNEMTFELYRTLFHFSISAAESKYLKNYRTRKIVLLNKNLKGKIGPMKVN